MVLVRFWYGFGKVFLFFVLKGGLLLRGVLITSFLRFASCKGGSLCGQQKVN